MDNKTFRDIIKECARTREYPPDYRADGSKMSLAERAALAPTMPLRSAAAIAKTKRESNRYRLAVCEDVAVYDRGRDECFDLTW